MRKQNYDMVSVGLRLRRARENVGITQNALSIKIDVNPQHISDIERGNAGISIDSLIAICEALNISSDYILFDKDIKLSGNPIFDDFLQLKDKDKAFIEDFVEFYIKRLSN